MQHTAIDHWQVLSSLPIDVRFHDGPAGPADSMTPEAVRERYKQEKAFLPTIVWKADGKMVGVKVGVSERTWPLPSIHDVTVDHATPAKGAGWVSIEVAGETICSTRSYSDAALGWCERVAGALAALSCTPLAHRGGEGDA